MIKFRRAAVLGSGTMGPGIGAVLARGGLEVSLFDTEPTALERAKSGVAAADRVLDQLDGGRTGMGRVRFESELERALDGADIVVEAVPERLEVKRQVLAECERFVAPETILASNTSGVPITQIAAVCEHPDRVVGMHWSNPPHLIPMIEVIAGEKTAVTVVDRTAALIKAFGYYPVTVKQEVPGFVENRILYAILRECMHLVDRGVIDASDLDLCVRWGIGYKLAVIGPMELLDMAGLDIYAAVGSYLNRDLSNAAEVSPTITRLTGEGRLGLKTGRGIFEYTAEDIEAKQAQRAARLVAVRKALSAGQTST
jgi:3-hydroxybutyryl-CoA dehydrogenase/5-formyl-3-hydroxy-2-methylpyridine 4-carboxylate dehydrogenase